MTQETPIAGEVSAEPQIGDKMPDGTVFAGLSPYTRLPMYVMPADAPLKTSFNRAQRDAAKLDAHGHQDWRVPTISELDVLFNNRAAIGGFKATSPYPTDYWSSSAKDQFFGWSQEFTSGKQFGYMPEGSAAVRYVRVPNEKEATRYYPAAVFN